MADDDINSLPHEEKQGLLMHAAAEGRADVIQRILRCNQALKESIDAEGFSPLHHAVSRGKVDAVRTLLRAGVPVDSRATSVEHAGKLALELCVPGDTSVRDAFVAEMLQSVMLGDVRRTEELLRGGVGPHDAVGLPDPKTGESQSLLAFAEDLLAPSPASPATAGKQAPPEVNPAVEVLKASARGVQEGREANKEGVLGSDVGAKAQSGESDQGDEDRQDGVPGCGKGKAQQNEEPGVTSDGIVGEKAVSSDVVGVDAADDEDDDDGSTWSLTSRGGVVEDEQRGRTAAATQQAADEEPQTRDDSSQLFPLLWPPPKHCRSLLREREGGECVFAAKAVVVVSIPLSAWPAGATSAAATTAAEGTAGARQGKKTAIAGEFGDGGDGGEVELDSDDSGDDDDDGDDEEREAELASFRSSAAWQVLTSSFEKRNVHLSLAATSSTSLSSSPPSSCGGDGGGCNGEYTRGNGEAHEASGGAYRTPPKPPPATAIALAVNPRVFSSHHCAVSQSFRLSVCPLGGGVSLVAGGAAGLLYGARCLAQLVAFYGDEGGGAPLSPPLPSSLGGFRRIGGGESGRGGSKVSEKEVRGGGGGGWLRGWGGGGGNSVPAAAGTLSDGTLVFNHNANGEEKEVETVAAISPIKRRPSKDTDGDEEEGDGEENGVLIGSGSNDHLSSDIRALEAAAIPVVLRLPALVIEDYPDFDVRAAVLDARSPRLSGNLLSTVSSLAAWRANTLHLVLGDVDRCSLGSAGGPGGGAWSAGSDFDFQSLCALCERNFVTLVPAWSISRQQPFGEGDGAVAPTVATTTHGSSLNCNTTTLAAAAGSAFSSLSSLASAAAMPTNQISLIFSPVTPAQSESDDSGKQEEEGRGLWSAEEVGACVEAFLSPNRNQASTNKNRFKSTKSKNKKALLPEGQGQNGRETSPTSNNNGNNNGNNGNGTAAVAATRKRKHGKIKVDTVHVWGVSSEVLQTVASGDGGAGAKGGGGATSPWFPAVLTAVCGEDEEDPASSSAANSGCHIPRFVKGGCGVGGLGLPSLLQCAPLVCSLAHAALKCIEERACGMVIQAAPWDNPLYPACLQELCFLLGCGSAWDHTALATPAFLRSTLSHPSNASSLRGDGDGESVFTWEGNTAEANGGGGTLLSAVSGREKSAAGGGGGGVGGNGIGSRLHSASSLSSATEPFTPSQGANLLFASLVAAHLFGLTQPLESLKRAAGGVGGVGAGGASGGGGGSRSRSRSIAVAGADDVATFVKVVCCTPEQVRDCWAAAEEHRSRRRLSRLSRRHRVPTDAVPVSVAGGDDHSFLLWHLHVRAVDSLATLLSLKTATTAVATTNAHNSHGNDGNGGNKHDTDNNNDNDAYDGAATTVGLLLAAMSEKFKRLQQVMRAHDWSSQQNAIRWMDLETFTAAVTRKYSKVQRCLVALYLSLDLLRLSCRLVQQILVMLQSSSPPTSASPSPPPSSAACAMLGSIPARTRSDIANKLLDLYQRFAVLWRLEFAGGGRTSVASGGSGQEVCGGGAVFAQPLKLLRLLTFDLPNFQGDEQIYERVFAVSTQSNASVV